MGGFFILSESIFFVYVIYSPSYDKFYIGQTEDIDRRLIEHNNHFFSNASTKFADDWEIFHLIICSSRSQAIKIESHLKKSKNKVYLENLKKYPEISERLIEKYKDNDQ
ncbi:MAG TPA: endonuclease [Algoriphagus sp.]|jgi:putative endonuclease|uniref:GIY-YIG nuclease family protein n=1 Tax=unclassified Algoriphagus TaxID=2641541 RepID=UPI000C6C0CF6|nr:MULTISPECIES: GIY-YIG nuclease family protein [unclassified Algoriphagus]MAL11997.1 endonuclease [Algoriphagus sp.]MAN87379.1 endonuclease [Algoriphagus sp.]HAD53405.1 endonuclease [Algoriphagus sp.]HAH38569.1 endonuclease [Algoriphagus sp.]HAS57075.1 endonuclease [Algoriphagus sp.]|tara:strand:+ start:113 stop:439 length:327 start_codon:yes stop_codon:yes gene_type:complete